MSLLNGWCTVFNCCIALRFTAPDKGINGSLNAWNFPEFTKTVLVMQRNVAVRTEFRRTTAERMFHIMSWYYGRKQLNQRIKYMGYYTISKLNEGNVDKQFNMPIR
jgi:hypothetical protein